VKGRNVDSALVEWARIEM